MTNPDIKQALGYVLCEPTDDGIKLSADGVDITEEAGVGVTAEMVQLMIDAAIGDAIGGSY